MSQKKCINESGSSISPQNHLSPACIEDIPIWHDHTPSPPSTHSFTIKYQHRIKDTTSLCKSILWVIHQLTLLISDSLLAPLLNLIQSPYLTGRPNILDIFSTNFLRNISYKQHIDAPFFLRRNILILLSKDSLPLNS